MAKPLDQLKMFLKPSHTGFKNIFRISRIFKQTGKQTKGVLCVTILVPFGNVCKYLPYYYSAILEKFIHIIYLLQKVKRGAREKICCTLGWHVIRKSIVFTHLHTYQAFFKGICKDPIMCIYLIRIIPLINNMKTLYITQIFYG